MSTATHTEKWDRVTRHDPCPICDDDHWCVVSPDGAVAGCMRRGDAIIAGKPAFKTIPTALGDMYLYHVTDEPREPRTVRPKPPEAPQRNVIADRAVYALVVEACAPLPACAEAELVRRFGPVYGPQAAARFHIGYCDGPALLAAIEATGRRREAIDAGVINADGTVSWALLDRLVIPYLRDGLVHDLRGAGIKGRDETKEISLRGGYAARGVADLFYNDDALHDLGPDGALHLAGGAYKTMALHAAGLNAVGLRGEAELSDGHIARLRAAGVRTIIRHIDAEDPKEGQDLSAGRRLGLTVAERLAAAGFAVLMAEPPREPGTPKVDPDALLRDLGPRAVRDYALSALPLAAWRVLIGADTAPAPHLLAERDTMIATLRADVARLGDQVRATDRELAEVREARDFYRLCLDCPDPVLGRALPVMAEELHHAYQQGAPLVQDGHEFVRLRFEHAAEGKPINRGAVATAAARLGPDTPHLARPATFRRNGQDKPTTHHYFACPVEERGSVVRLGLGLLNRATPQQRHAGRKPPKVLPPAVAAQTAPVRREQQHIDRFYSLRDETQLATVTTTGVTDYWTPDGEQLTQEAARAWQVAHGVRAATVETQQHYHAPPVRLFVGARPPTHPTVATQQPGIPVEFQQHPLNVNSAQTQQHEPPLDPPGVCPTPDCGRPIVVGGYCEQHFTSHRDTSRQRAEALGYGYAAGAD